MIEKIKAIFEKVNCPAIVILKTPRAGDEVDNGYGVDFDLSEYAVIHKNHLHDYKTVYDWERENNIDVMKFSRKDCSSIQGLIDELNSVDGYEIVWQKNPIYM